MKTIIIPALVLLVSGCAGEYKFNSNLSGEAIDDYFKVSDVTVYENSLPSGNFERKGLVEGESCQIAANDAPANIVEARTKARRSAADKGANGLIIKTCFVATEQTQQCISNAICIGQAIKTADTATH
ncbi:MAG: RcsF protein [Shewanella sp.]|jgi:RcsF protein